MYIVIAWMKHLELNCSQAAIIYTCLIAYIPGLYTEIFPGGGGEFGVWKKTGGGKLNSLRDLKCKGGGGECLPADPP